MILTTVCALAEIPAANHVCHVGTYIFVPILGFEWTKVDMDPKELSARLNAIADGIDASKQPSRELVASALRDTIAAVERSKDKEKGKKKIDKKDVDSSTAATMHMGLLDKYKDFHDTGANLLGFRSLVDGVPETSPKDVLAAQQECTAAFDALDTALKNARACYSRLMAALAQY